MGKDNTKKPTTTQTTAPYQLSYQDFKRYFSCPKKVAFRTLGIKARTYTRIGPQIPTYEIGKSGEEITAEILTLIAQVQDKIVKHKGKVHPADVSEAITDEMVADYDGFDDTLESISTDSLPMEQAEQVERVKRTLMERVGENVRLLAGEVGRILSVSRPRYRNRDMFATGFPDFQIETLDGHQLVEVKNLKNPTPKGIEDAVNQTQLYLSMLEDNLVSDAVITLDSALGLLRNFPDRIPHLLGVDRVDDEVLRQLQWKTNLTLPSPPTGLVFMPRQSQVQVVERGLEGFRKLAAEIWKIKRAAVAEGELPYVEMTPELCKSCGFKAHCKEGISLEAVPPAGLVFALGELEVGPPKREPPTHPFGKEVQEQLWEAGLTKWHFPEELEKIWDLRTQLRKAKEKQRLHQIYREFPEIFDKWGGKAVANDPRLRQSTHLFYRTDPYALDRLAELVQGEQKVLDDVRKRWRVS